jgi:site-specific DNA-methyltransferase (adenine-specific)
MEYPEDFVNKIICGDCLEVMKDIPDNSIDLLIFSPPYDEIRNYKGFPKLDLHSIGNQCFRILKFGGVVSIVIQDGTKDFAKSLTTFRTAVDWCDSFGFKLFETVIYKRDGRPGAWWSKRFRVDHEYILIFFKGDKPKSFNKEPLKIKAKHAGEVWHGTQRLTNGDLIPIKKTEQKDLKCRGTIWNYEASKSEHNKLKNLHPAPFPDKLAKDLILCFSKENDVVLDIMSGSGTTVTQAKATGRNFIGMDISDEYCKIAEQRLNEYASTN